MPLGARGHGRRRWIAVGIGAALAVAVFSGSSSGAVRAHATTAPSQELPPLGALSPIGTRSVLGIATGYPSFRWKFPSRDGSAVYWVTMDDTPLANGVKLTSGGSSIYSQVSDWIYFASGIELADGTSSGPGWALYFFSNDCSGQNWWVMSGATNTQADCPKGAWDTIASELGTLPGTWLSVGPDFEACSIGVQNWGGSCRARFVSASEMSRYVTPTTDVQVFDGQPWDVGCPANGNSPPCWTPPPPFGRAVAVTASAAQNPILPGTTADSFSVAVTNTNGNKVSVSSVSAGLPSGFAYVPGSTAGAITRNPTVSGRTLTWPGPFVLAANGGNLAFTFGVSIDSAVPEGEYGMTASAVTDATYSATATVTIASKTPLIFVPGVMGSELICNGTRVWPDAFYDIGSFALTNHGTGESTCPSAMTAGGPIFKYDPTIAGLESSGYVLGKTLFPYGYDWRKSVTEAAGGLLAFIDQVRAQTGAAKVDIMAHSQGGLVTRVALTTPQSHGKVRRVLTLATPFYGAGKLLSILLAGRPCPTGQIDLSVVQFLWWHLPAWCPVGSGATLEDLLKTLPGPLDLMPSFPYFDAVGPPISVGNIAVAGPRYQAYLESAADPFLVDSAFLYHQTFDGAGPQDPSVRWTQVVGRGLLTLAGVHFDGDGTLNWVEFPYADGDGTVPSGSALSGGLFPTAHTEGYPHIELATGGCVLDFAVHYFADDVPPASAGCVLAGSGTVSRSLAVRRDAQPAGLEIAVDGAVSVAISDAAGDVGPDIPNSDVNAIGASESFLLRDPGSYHASVTAGASGIARVRIRVLGSSGAPNEQALFLLPSLPVGATVSFDATAADVGTTRLAVDLNGDGVVDEVLAPDAVTSGSAASDTTAPAAYGDATSASAGMSIVTLGADDADSGVAHVYYRVGAGPEQTYGGPFTVPMFSTIAFRAMDRAGNMSAETSFVADDAPNTMRFADPLTPSTPLLRTIAPQGDVDWFTFRSDGTWRYRVQLSQLPADYDLRLFDSAGNLVAAPRAHGRSPEEIFQQLPSGTYFVEVSAATDTTGANRPWDQDHPYRLQLLAVAG